MISKALSTLPPDHVVRLRWYEDRIGREISFPEEIGPGLHLAGKAKGIYKPKGSDYALSIRLNNSGPYQDGFTWLNDGGWELRYAQEGDPMRPPNELFTNRGLLKCMHNEVPVGVLEQVRTEPRSRYLVRGLATPTGWSEGVFTFRSVPIGTTRVLDTATAGLLAACRESTVTNPGAIDSAVDARIRSYRLIAQRQGQPQFRAELLAAYGSRCAITGCMTVEVLEAAHLLPYRGPHTNVVTNGLPLRADVHTLLDLQLIAIEPTTRKVVGSKHLPSDPYLAFIGEPLREPFRVANRPDTQVLESLWQEFLTTEVQRS